MRVFPVVILLFMLFPGPVTATEGQDTEPRGTPQSETLESPARPDEERTISRYIDDSEIDDYADLDLEKLLANDIRGGETGSYTRRLSELGTPVTLNGYLSTELKSDLPEGPPTFDLHHMVVMLRANLLDRLYPELALEWEHSGESFYVPFAFVDTVAFDWLIIRAGYFPVPVGVFNEYLYPDYLRTTAKAPLMSRSIIPSLWSEVGLQVRGKVPLTSDIELNYALFVANGLEQPDADPTDTVVPEGGDIRDMRRHDRDAFDGDKAFGGRIGVTLFKDLDLGISGYTGAYTVDGKKRLSIFDVDVTYRTLKLSARLEGVLAIQEITGDNLVKYGAYALVAYRVIDFLEPYLQSGFISFDGARTYQGFVGVGLYPFPKRAPFNVLKLDGGVQYDEANGKTSGFILAQFVLGF